MIPNAANCISIRRSKSASTASERRKGMSGRTNRKGARVQEAIGLSGFFGLGLDRGKPTLTSLIYDQL